MPPKIECSKRAKQDLVDVADDNKVTVYAPKWVEDMLPEITKWLDGCEVFLSKESKFTISQDNPVTLQVLQMISRNESINTTGIIAPNQFPGLTPEQIYAIKDLVRHCVVVGTDVATQYGGYPLNSTIKIDDDKQKPTIICDLAALQFQKPYNSGRLVLIPVDGTELPKGELDDRIYQATVGETKKTAAEIKALEEEPKKQYPQVTCFDEKVYLDLNVYKKFVAKDFILATLTVNEQGNKIDAHNIWFNFLNYGVGFFAEAGDNAFKDQLKTNIYAGILQGLTEIFNNPELKQQLTNIKVFSFPHFAKKEDKTVKQIIEQISKLCEDNGKSASFQDCDALQPHNGYTLATTNCGDPHAMAGNEMNHGSVDAAIAENVAGNLNTFSAWLNTQMQQKYLPISEQFNLEPEPHKSPELPKPAEPPKPQPPAEPEDQPNLTIPQNIFNPAKLSTLLQEHYSLDQNPGSRLPKFPPNPNGSFIYEDRENIQDNSPNTSFIGRIIHTLPATQSPSKAGAKQTNSSTKKTTIANIFHESNKVILKFPPNPDGSIKPTQKDWIVDFLEKFLSNGNDMQPKSAENQVPVVTAHGFTPEDLMNLLEKIHKINSNSDNENKILLKIDCTDATEEYALVKHNIEIHNQNIEKLINLSSHGTTITLAPLLETLPDNPKISPTSNYAHP